MPVFTTIATFDVSDIDSWSYNKAKVIDKPIKCVHGPVAITFLVQYYPKGTTFLDNVDDRTACVGIDFVEHQNDQLRRVMMELRCIAVLRADNTLHVLKQCTGKLTRLDRALGRYEHDMDLPMTLAGLRQKEFVKPQGKPTLTFHIWFEVGAESFLLSKHLREREGRAKLFMHENQSSADVHLRELFEPIDRATVDGRPGKRSAANWCLVSGDGFRFYVHTDIIKNSGSDWLIEKSASVPRKEDRPKSSGDKLPERVIKHLDGATLREILRVIYLHVEPQRFPEIILDLYDGADYLRMEALKFECVVRMLQMCEDGLMPMEKIVRWCRVVHDVPEMPMATELQLATINIIISRFESLSLRHKEKLNAQIVPRKACTLYHLIMEHMCANHNILMIKD